MSITAVLDHGAVADGAVPALSVGADFAGCLEVASTNLPAYTPVADSSEETIESLSTGPEYRVVGAPVTDAALAPHLWLLRCDAVFLLPAAPLGDLIKPPKSTKIEMRGVISVAWGPNNYGKRTAAYRSWRVEKITRQRTVHVDPDAWDHPQSDEIEQMSQWGQQRGETWRYLLQLALPTA